MRVKSRISLKGNRRTRTPGTGSNNSSRRTESRILVVQSEGTEQAVNTRDAGVTSTCDVQLQNTVTYTSHIPEGYPEEVFPHSSDSPFCLSLPRTERPTPEGGRSESQRRIAGFNDSASLGQQDCGTIIQKHRSGTRSILKGTHHAKSSM